ncbi:hypothetical protein GCM10028793_45970 [Nocardiopsis oceani]
MPKAAVAGLRARTTVRAATAEGVGPLALPGKSVRADGADLIPRAVSGAMTSLLRDPAEPVPKVRRRAPKGVRAPRADAVAPRAGSGGAPKTGSVRAVGQGRGDDPDPVQTGSVRAVRRTVTAPGAVRTTRAPVDAVVRRAPVTPATESTEPAPRAVVRPPTGPEAGVPAAAAVAAAVPARTSPTTAPGSSASCPRPGSPHWRSAG